MVYIRISRGGSRAERTCDTLISYQFLAIFWIWPCQNIVCQCSPTSKT